MTEDKSTRYHRLRRRAEWAGTLGAALVLAALTVSGGALRLREWAYAAASLAAPAGTDDLVAAALVAAAVLLLVQVVELPSAWVHGFVLEHRYGLSAQTARRWWRDHLTGAALVTGIGVAAASVVLLALRRWPATWWLVSTSVFAVGLVALVGLTPTLVLPLFYTVRPLDRPALAARLVALARRANTDVVGIFEWVVSSHTRKANAALAGLGRTRRILLSDTLLADYSDDEIEVVLAHELAHHVHRDLWRGLGLQVLLLLGGFLTAHLVLEGAAAVPGYRGPSDPAVLPLLLLTGGAWSLAVLPLVAWQSRTRERAADRFALEATGNPAAFISAMKRLAQQNMVEDRPGTWSRWLLSHPPIGERLDLARAFTRT